MSLDSLVSFSSVVISIAIATLLVLIPRTARVGRRLLVALVATWWVVSVWIVPNFIGLQLARSIPPLAGALATSEAPVIVLLAASSNVVTDWNGRRQGDLSAEGFSRVMEAARMYRLHPDALIISSGGTSAAGPPGGGEQMRDALITLGVPPSHIALEATSRDTHDEAVLVAAMLKTSRRPVILVTSRLHMPRALKVFAAAGVVASPAAAKPGAAPGGLLRFIPTADGLGMTNAVAHELVGLAYYTARGWI